MPCQEPQARSCSDRRSSDLRRGGQLSRGGRSPRRRVAALGSGYAERGIGAAAMGAIAEDDSLFVNGLILTVLPETLVILALVVVFIS
ncbi:hypothetical protein C8039_07640 [Halogeometricum sp. wsp3]|nr:hypothetical protein C8039_07640 [Halogeometricum sp. wsp3]